MTLFGSCVIAGWLCAGAAAAGQTLRVPVSEAKVGEPGAFSLNLESPPGKAPASLQWDLAVPSVVAIESTDITAGGAAQAAGKTVTCGLKSGKSSTPEPVRYTCILAGGVTPIDNGAVASIHYRVRTPTDGAPIRVGIENVLAVFVDLRQIKLPDVDAIIQVR